MREDLYVAGQIEDALHSDPRTDELGDRVAVDGDQVVLHGEVASEERRRLLTEVAEDSARGLAIRNDVSVTEVLPPPDVPEVLPLPGEVVSSEVPPPRHAWS